MASTETLKNNLGMVLATITTASNGVQTIKDPIGYVLGTYDPKTNTTRNNLGQVIGTGNLLTSLIR